MRQFEVFGGLIFAKKNLQKFCDGKFLRMRDFRKFCQLNFCIYAVFKNHSWSIEKIGGLWIENECRKSVVNSTQTQKRSPKLKAAKKEERLMALGICSWKQLWTNKALLQRWKKKLLWLTKLIILEYRNYCTAFYLLLTNSSWSLPSQ